jgi:multicomponent Na+:H+ antiporter subunit C
VRKVLAANVMVSGIFLVFIALGRRSPPVTDPVPQAMVLTGIVIAVSTTALALALIKRLYSENRSSDASTSPPDETTAVDL